MGEGAAEAVGAPDRVMREEEGILGKNPKVTHSGLVLVSK